MANEARITSFFHINKGNLKYSPIATSFFADVTGTKGPVPGAITVTPTGVDVDFSELTTPGLWRISNLDATNYVTYGTWDPETTKFYPHGELLPGEFFTYRLSRDLGNEYDATTGTAGPITNTLQFRADTADCVVVIEAFEK